jgi:hypothetical protein
MRGALPVHGSGEGQLAAGVEDDVPEDPPDEVLDEAPDDEDDELDALDDPVLAGDEDVVDDVLDDFEERESVR